MLSIVPKWRIVVSFAAGPDVTYWVSEHHLSNVLQTVARIDFSETGLDQPTRLTVDRVKDRPQDGVFHG